MTTLMTTSARRGWELGDFGRRIKSFRAVLFAVMLQDMRTRFGGSYLGFLIAIAWPLAHIAMIVTVRSLLMKYASMGTDPAIFVATGSLPYILFIYPARFVAMAVVSNGNLMSLPPVTPMIIMLSRLLLEFMNAIIVLTIFIFALYTIGINFVPNNIPQAFFAILSTIYLGVSFGAAACIFNGVVGRFFMVPFVLTMIVLYLSSGAYFEINVPDGPIKEFLSYNPLHQVVAWFRASYFLDMPRVPHDAMYVIHVATAALAFAFAGERLLRGKLLR